MNIYTRILSSDLSNRCFFGYQEPLDECRRGHVMRKPNSSLPTLGKALALLGKS